jgi:hypothetical protein
VKYKNGKIMYHHGTLLPAKISFLAHDAPPIATLQKENSLCIHEIRNHVKFSDPKKGEEPKNSKKLTKKHKKYKLCDSQTLHAHAVRLNPVHAQPGEKLSDLAHLLTPAAAQTSISEERNSPKKTRNCKKSPKKVVAVTKSPSSSSGNSATTSPPSPSKALQTAKKLKNLVEEGEEPQKKKQKTADDPPPMPKITLVSKPVEKSSKKPKTDVPSTSKQVEEPEDKRGTGGWTREEDKIILEQFKIGYDSKESLLDALTKKLSRKREEIDERYDFLLDILMMIKN